MDEETARLLELAKTNGVILVKDMGESLPAGADLHRLTGKREGWGARYGGWHNQNFLDEDYGGPEGSKRKAVEWLHRTAEMYGYDQGKPVKKRWTTEMVREMVDRLRQRVAGANVSDGAKMVFIKMLDETFGV